MYNCINIARIDLKRVFNCGKKHKAFSMAEMLVVMLILAIVIISMTPVAVKRVKKEAVNPEHGSYECFYEPSGTAGVYNLIQRTRNAQGVILDPNEGTKIGEYDVKNPPATPLECTFTPPRGAMFFTVNAVGGGSPGTGSTAVFNLLPRGVSNQPGVNYTNSYSKHRSVLVDTSQNSTFHLTGATFGSLSTESPVKWINDSGINIYAYFQSDGGTLDDSTQGGYIYKTRIAPEGNSKCTDNTGYDLSNFKNKESTSYGYRRWTTADGDTCIEWNYNWFGQKTTCKKYEQIPCIEAAIFPGTDPASGSTARLSMTLKDGTAIYNTGTEGAPAFGIGSNGCSIAKGSNGCFGSCPETNGKISDYNSTVKCKGGSTSPGGGYPKNKRTITTANMSSDTLGGVKFSYSPICMPSSSSSTGFISGGGSECSTDAINWVQDNPPTEYSSKWFLHTMGNLVYVMQKLNKGVNFYAQAGNPGDFKTLYVSRFAKTISIAPGAPKMANSTDNSVAGNDTTIRYRDNNELLLRVAGGKKAIASASTETSDKTFIVGNLFNLPLPTSPRVIAYDNESGDLSGSNSEYGGYFRPKDSGFVYPIPDTSTGLPSTVGQGGHGSYTIFRSTGNSEGYRVLKVLYKSLWNSKNWIRNIKDNSYTDAKRSLEAYTCMSDGRTLSGESTANGTTSSYRCYAGDGQGGAVVITW